MEIVRKQNITRRSTDNSEMIVIENYQIKNNLYYEWTKP